MLSEKKQACTYTYVSCFRLGRVDLVHAQMHSSKCRARVLHATAVTATADRTPAAAPAAAVLALQHAHLWWLDQTLICSAVQCLLFGRLFC